VPPPTGLEPTHRRYPRSGLPNPLIDRLSNPPASSALNGPPWLRPRRCEGRCTGGVPPRLGMLVATACSGAPPQSPSSQVPAERVGRPRTAPQGASQKAVCQGGSRRPVYQGSESTGCCAVYRGRLHCGAHQRVNRGAHQRVHQGRVYHRAWRVHHTLGYRRRAPEGVP